MHSTSASAGANGDLAPSHAEVEQCARELWARSGCPVGRDEAIWLEAERRLTGAQRAQLTPAAMLIAVARWRSRARLSQRAHLTWTQ